MTKVDEHEMNYQDARVSELSPLGLRIATEKYYDLCQDEQLTATSEYEYYLKEYRGDCDYYTLGDKEMLESEFEQAKKWIQQEMARGRSALPTMMRYYTEHFLSIKAQLDYYDRCQILAAQGKEVK